MNIDLLRAQTPACANLLHFNNAGASLMPDAVNTAVTGQAHEALASFYRSFGRLLSAEPSEIAFVENATRAWDMAFYGLALQPGDRVITHVSEYASNFLAMLHRAKRNGTTGALLRRGGLSPLPLPAGSLSRSN